MSDYFTSGRQHTSIPRNAEPGREDYFYAYRKRSAAIVPRRATEGPAFEERRRGIIISTARALKYFIDENDGDPTKGLEAYQKDPAYEANLKGSGMTIEDFAKEVILQYEQDQVALDNQSSD